MKIQTLQITEHRIPFRFSFKHALAERSVADGVIVRAGDAEGRFGFGECLPRGYVTGETPETVKEALQTDMARQLLGAGFASPQAVVEGLRSILDDVPRNQQAAFCALELAVLDLAGRTFGISAGELVFGPVVHEEIHYSGVVSADQMETAMEACKMIKAIQPDRVKLKVGVDLDLDIAILRGAQEILGPDCRFRIDANCAWTAEEALRCLETLAPFNLESVEQPLPAADHEGLAWLTARSPTPVILDESLASVDDARQVIDEGLGNHFNIRISKCGGLINAARLREMGREAGIGCQLGAQVGESVLLSAAGRQFGTRCEDVLFHEGSYGTFLLKEDIGVQDLTIGAHGVAPALEGVGLGVDVDQARLDSFVVERIDL